MVYEPTKSLALRLLRVPDAPPDPPAGSHASVRVFRASPRYLRYRLFRIGIGLVPAIVFEGIAAIGALAAGGLGGHLLAAFLGMLLVATAALAVFVARVEYDVRYYVVTDRSLRVRSGAWTVREMTITYANVQNLRVVQGPVQRLFGISDVAVDTAGGGGAVAQGSQHAIGHRVEIAGIENPGEIRDLVLAHLRAHAAGTGLGDVDDVSAPRHAVPAVAGSPEFLQALRELRDAARALRNAAAA